MAMPERESVTVAVVGGTTFGHPPDFGRGLVEEEATFTVQTAAGESPTLYQLRYAGTSFYYVRMHGEEARRSGEPEGWEFVKTWAALHELGVSDVLGGATCGGINAAYREDDLVVVDDFVILGNPRPRSILRAAGIQRGGRFPRFDVPFCPDLRRLLIEEARAYAAGRVHDSGVLFQGDPGRFETPAEIRLMRQGGADLVSLNVATEAVYARQLGIHFALLCSISNPAVGLGPFSFQGMQASVSRIATGSVPIVLRCIARVPTLEHACGDGCTGERYTGSYTLPESEG
jgi:5'-methylthioadenosine phosphorylase